MATAEQYAEWIVANADKKGTPDFETVAKAYLEVRGQAPKTEEQSGSHAEIAKGNNSSSSAPIRIDLGGAALESGFAMLWSALLAFLVLRVTAYKYWKKVRVTPVANGVWCGGIAAALAPFGVMNKIAQRVSISEYAASLIVVALLYFVVAFVAGFVWRKLKAPPIQG